MNRNIKSEVKKDESVYEETIKQLWGLITKANPKQREKIIGELDEKTVTALRTYSNPYKKPVIAGDKCKLLAFNTINMTEKYCRRFAITSVIGFLYRMLDEFTPLSSEKYISENDFKFADKYNKKVKELIENGPEILLLKRWDELKLIITELKSGDDKKKLKESILESYIVRSKIFNHKLNLVKADVEILKSKKDRMEKNNDSELPDVVDSLRLIDEKVSALNKSLKELKSEYSSKFPKSNHLDNVTIDRYEPSEDELNDIANQVKLELEIDCTAEEHSEKIQNTIQEFLDLYLKYNPDNHVRCAYKPNYDDPKRNQLTKNETTYERSVIPPDDTFSRLDRYIENNYEPLRQATDDIYCEKSDFEFDIVPLEVFDGDNEDEALELFNQYKRKYADEFETDVFCAKFYSHNLLSPWYQNRDVRDFYTEKTEIIKRILDQNKEDARMGQKLMKDRAKKKKEEDVKKMGPDPLSHKKYLAANPPKELEKHGAVHVDKLIVKEDVPIDVQESTNDEVEVGVHVIKPIISRSSGQRRVRGFAEQWKFNIPVEKNPEGSAKVQTPAEFQNAQNKNKN